MKKLVNKIRYVLLLIFLCMAVYFGIKDYQVTHMAEGTYQQLTEIKSHTELSEEREVGKYEKVLENRKWTYIMGAGYFCLVFVLVLSAGKQRDYVRRLSVEEANKIAEEINQELISQGLWVDSNEDELEEDDSEEIYFLEQPVITSAELVGRTIKIKWSKVPHADGYIILRKAAGRGWATVKKVGSNITEYTDYRLFSNAGYYHTVKAYRENELERVVSSFDETVKEIFVFEGTRCEELNLQKRTETNGDVTLYWDLLQGADLYSVFRKKEGEDWDRICRLSKDKNEYTISKDNIGNQFIYTVAGVKKEGKVLVRGVVHEGYLI